MFNDPVSSRTITRSLAVTAAVLLCACLGACAVHWPWQHRLRPAPQPVQELSLQPAAAILQFWHRNALLLDLSALSGDGAVTLGAPAGHGWPIRLEFRVRPGSIARLEVQGSERVVFEIPTQGAPMVLKLSPEVYVPGTAQITVRWSAADGSAR
jgi:hypothetical protein